MVNVLSYAISFLKKKRIAVKRRTTSGYLTLKWRKLCVHAIIVIASARAFLCPPGSKRPQATRASQRSERGLALVTSLLVTGPRQTYPRLFSNLTAAILYIIGGYRAKKGKIGAVASIWQLIMSWKKNNLKVLKII